MYEYYEGLIECKDVFNSGCSKNIPNLYFADVQIEDAGAIGCRFTQSGEPLEVYATLSVTGNLWSVCVKFSVST